MSSVLSGAMRRVLLLGSGYTSAPLVEFLTRSGDISITVASDSLEQANQLAETHQNTVARHLDLKSEEELSMVVRNHELVISLVPQAFHPVVAKHCLAAKTNMVTASYVSPSLQALHLQAVEQGITIMNEVGLDPGVDHMLAMQCIDEVHNKGGKIMSFESWCGGLPHPKYSDNPLKYKFSWSPSGVLMAARNPAKYIKDNKMMEIIEGTLMDPENVSSFRPEESPLEDVEFEGYFNRDSTKYKLAYGIPEAETVVRGTYRYKEYCKITRALYKLGLLDATEHERLRPGSPDLKWKDVFSLLQTGDHTTLLESVEGDEEIIGSLERLGLLSDNPVHLCGSPLATLCSHLEQVLKYQVGEKDAIFLHHFIGIQWPNNKLERRHIYMNLFGTVGVPGQYTAMAEMVGKPVAIGAKLILDGKMNRKGIVIPTTSDIYEPILEGLRDEGIVAIITKNHLCN